MSSRWLTARSGLWRNAVAVEVGQPGDFRERRAALDGADEIAEGEVAFTAHDQVDAEPGIFEDLGRERRIVAADDDAHAGAEGADEPNHPQRRAALEGHDGEADEIGLMRGDQVRDGVADVRLRENQIRDRDVMVRIDVAGERGERAVRHPDGERRRVLERIRHRQQQNSHDCSGTSDERAGDEPAVREGERMEDTRLPRPGQARAHPGSGWLAGWLTAWLTDWLAIGRLARSAAALLGAQRGERIDFASRGAPESPPRPWPPARTRPRRR